MVLMLFSLLRGVSLSGLLYLRQKREMRGSGKMEIGQEGCGSRKLWLWRYLELQMMGVHLDRS